MNDCRTTPQETVFSFRAECLRDACAFVQALWDASIYVTRLMIDHEAGMPAPDVVGEFAVAGHVERDRLISATRDVDGIHVLLETLRPVPLAHNSLDRENVDA